MKKSCGWFVREAFKKVTEVYRSVTPCFKSNMRGEAKSTHSAHTQLCRKHVVNVELNSSKSGVYDIFVRRDGVRSENEYEYEHEKDLT